MNDKQSRSEKGSLVQVGDNKVLTVLGSYSFIGTDGITYNVFYTADENGFKPTILNVNKTQQILPERNGFDEEENEVVAINPTLIKTILG